MTPAGSDRRLDRTARRRRGRRTALAAAVAVVLLVAAFGAINADVRLAARGECTTAPDAPVKPVAIVFGAGYSANGLTPVLEDRVATAADLYRLHKVRKLLMSGDNSRVSYNEPVAMEREAVRRGVPANDIVLDYAGFRTYDSLYRARDVFGVRSALLVTQAYHLPRALYIGRGLGMDVFGVPADRRDYSGMARFEVRELFSVANAWCQVNVLRPRPYFLGPRQPIG